MPGIHVRKTRWIDWTQKGENPTLTVPGSYWLCHKANIYKFIFKYHRTTRNVKQFNFGRELMKVIRRIIKNHPPQGQQFGTSHLLVTFNRTSWTRQDKMFAMLKFKERSVVAFSHAFVLTIKLSRSLGVEQKSKCVITSSDQPLIYQNENLKDAYENKNKKENKKDLKHSSVDDYLEKNIQFDNMEEQTFKLENRSIQLNNNVINNNFKKLSVEQTINDEDISKFCKNLNVSFKVHTTSDNSVKLNNNITESNVNCLQNDNTKHELSLEIIEVKNTKLSNRKKLNDYNILDNSIRNKDESVSSNNNKSNENNVDDINADSVNLPYQYLIEKEIENAKQNVKKYGFEEVNEKNSTNYTELNSDITKIQDFPCAKKKKYASDNEPRSSDITDLVMEGLMFTIRQEQDAVAVIEQKTKLEVDEVLENSEKIETKEGEKCLRNSSLLGLENLITMIELPKESEFEDKHQNVINQEPILRNQSVSKPLINDVKHSSTNDTIKKQNIAPELKHMQCHSFNNSISTSISLVNNNSNLSVRNKRHYSEIYDYKRKKDTKFAENQNLEYENKKKKEKEEEEEEEEDIIPEALQNKIFQPSTLSFKANRSDDKLKFIPNKDLLMDDIDNEEFIKSGIDKNPCFNKSSNSRMYSQNDCSDYNSISTNSVISEPQKLENNATYKSKCNDTPSNIPIVISNQIITLNEMPLPLQEMLRNKLSIKLISLNSENEINKDNIEIHKKQSCENEDNASNIQLENQISDNNILTNTQCLNHQKSMQDNKETHNENISSSPLQMKIKDPNISKNNVKLKEEKLQKQNSCINKVESPSDKIKDITQEFYKDLSYLQKKENLINQKYLRSRRKSLNILSDANNGEMHVQMVKFFQDITRGAKVVVRRISINKYS